jgi:acetoacetyl-CoA synthetase
MMQEGELLWTPSAEWMSSTNLAHFMNWLREHRGLDFTNYANLQRWSVDDLEGFWGALWDYLEIKSSAPYTRVLASETMPGAKWFEGARLNYAEHVLRNEKPGTDAMIFVAEDTAPRGIAWDEFADKVRKVATWLRAQGIEPGDRVVSYAPHIPETIVMMLATAAVGAIWASCSPDFGAQGALDRLAQLQPKVLFCVDGYRYNGKDFDRASELEKIVTGLPDLQHVVYFARLNPERSLSSARKTTPWREVIAGEKIPTQDFVFEQVAFDHPLWILFSSGTTGLPKAIVQGHGGILLETQKTLRFHMDVHAGERAFFYTTTGWMMWNVVVSMLIVGACPVVYDGSPAYPALDRLWQIADQCGVAFFGASPSFVQMTQKAGIVPKDQYAFKNLRAIMPAGSPVSPDVTAWFYDNVKRDLWIATGSGGTDVCSGLVGGTPLQPVYAGEIQARQLGTAIESFDEEGRSVVGQVGEMVVTKPMPSMPLYFWNDATGQKYHEAYFDMYPGVWRHGDLLRINERGGCFVLGRSDATLNRHGIRIGTAEIYRTLDQLEGIQDSLIVNLDLPGGHFHMPLFVQMKSGVELDAGFIERINAALRKTHTPRHVPDRIIQVEEIPYTVTRKKMEVPVRRILMGADPEKVLNRNTMANAKALDPIIAYEREVRKLL